MADVFKVPLVLTPQPEGGYTVTSPAIPELLTEGETQEEALGNAQDALAAVVELYKDLGKTFPLDYEVTYVAKSLVVRGDISTNGDLYIDGKLDGIVNAPERKVTVGLDGRVEGRVNAGTVVIYGTVKGEVDASARLEIRRTGILVGDVIAARILIEDGAYFKGSIDIQNPQARPLDKEPTEKVVFLEGAVARP